ncbi:MAG: V-type ATP synthase subunit I [Spirochaetaceae bacterium]
MIEQMKKASVVVLDAHRQEAVDRLREVGVLHVQGEEVLSDDLSHLKERRATIERALSVLSEPERNHADEQLSLEDAVSVAENALEKAEELRAAREHLDALEREALNLEPWGDFDPAAVQDLRARGIDVQLYAVPKQDFRVAKPEHAFVLHEGTTLVFFVQILVDTDDNEEVERAHNFTPRTLPERSLREVRDLVSEAEDEIERLERELTELSKQRPALERALLPMDDEIDFARVRDGMNTEDSLAFLTGYVPVGAAARLRDAAKRGGWGLLLQDPGPDDRVPTKVKNPKPISIIKPVFGLLGTTPGYNELDISFWFLIFLSIFFAMIIGDGGYGLIILGLSLFALIRGKKKSGSVGKGPVLLSVMSLATVAWGAVTGTWFGYEPIGDLPLFRALEIPAISSFNPRSRDTIQFICFALGTLQLSIAHLWLFIKGFKERPTVRAFADLGWLALVLGAYWLVLTVVIGRPLPEYSLYMIAAGFGVVILFGEQQERSNFFSGIGRGLNPISLFSKALDGISAFSDIISYIRLFAVGLATVEIAKAFNTMAEGVGDGVVGVVAAAFILFVGHTLNLVMGALSVVVHGIRLNMLEFSRHLGMEWSGVDYNPFRKREAPTTS